MKSLDEFINTNRKYNIFLKSYTKKIRIVFLATNYSLWKIKVLEYQFVCVVHSPDFINYYRVIFSIALRIIKENILECIFNFYFNFKAQFSTSK